MKNKTLAALVAVTMAFVIFVAGYYCGRNADSGPVELSGGILTHPTTAPTQATAAPTTASVPTSPATPPTPDMTQPDPTAPSGTVPSGKINLNTATLEQLDTLPNIGPTLAQRILDYRQQIGKFKSVDELLEVKGIGQKTLEKLLPYVTV